MHSSDWSVPGFLVPTNVPTDNGDINLVHGHADFQAEKGTVVENSNQCQNVHGSGE